MKIIEAYFDLSIRKGVKKYLLAQGMSITQIDKTYNRFGVYLSRLKSVNYDKLLMQYSSLPTFLECLHEIFDVKWVNNINYIEMPKFFYWYAEYLQTIVAIDPSLYIEGINPCFKSNQLEQLTDFELLYRKQGKLTLIANPNLIVQIAPILKGNGTLNEAIDVAKKFYGKLLPRMNRNDWGNILMQVWPQEPKKTRKATTRNVEIKYADGTSRVFSGNDAMIEVASIIGLQKLLTLKTIKHRGKEILTRFVEPANELAYKEFEDGWFINLLGNNNDKIKTLRVLNAICSLNLEISITTAEQTSERKTSFKIILK